jgi:hypothetical protein
MTSYDPLTKVDPQEDAGRKYDVCIVFSYKTSSDVRYGTEVDNNNKNMRDVDPSGMEASVMHMWEMRRNTVIRSLEQNGLDVKLVYSRDRDQIFCKVGASQAKLKEIAELTKYKLQLKPEYESAYAEYRQDYPGTPPYYDDRKVVKHLFRMRAANSMEDGLAEGSLFRTVDRVRLIDRCIRYIEKGCCGVDMADMMRPIQQSTVAAEAENASFFSKMCARLSLVPYPGTVDNYFPLHENAILNGFHTSWYEYMIPAHKIEEVRDYFGENVALYWKWVGFLMTALVILAVVGTGSLMFDIFDQTPNNFTILPYSIFAGLWATFLIHFWRRSTAHQCLKWGALDLEETLEPPRKEFYGDKRINPVTDKPELHYEWTKRIKFFAISFGVICSCLLLLLAMTVGLFTLRHIVHREYKNPNAPLYFQAINACIVEALNSAFSYVAEYLTHLENHRTIRQYQSHLLAKSFSFKFFNSYVSLYFIAFFKGHDTFLGPKMRCRNNDCLVDLGSQLFIFMIVRIFVSNLVEALTPKITSCISSFLEDRQMKKLAQGSPIFMYAGMSSMEIQAKREIPNTYNEMEETLFHYGYCILFVSAAPWMPLVVLFAFIVETTLDKTKFYKLYQRPWPIIVGSNEPWDTAFDVMSIFAMLTNVAIVIFATDEFAAYTMTEKLTWFFLIENAMIACRILVATLFPSRPTYVDKLVTKHRVIAQKHLDCVETTIDVQPFVDHTMSARKVVVADRDEEHDDEEDDD